jgi:hypothetical protein
MNARSEDDQPRFRDHSSERSDDGSEFGDSSSQVMEPNLSVCLGSDMNKQDKERRFEGIVRAFRSVSGVQGKPFLGAIMECGDLTEWVIDYDEQSPFHTFADHHVVVFGEPYEPLGQHLISTGGKQTLRHLRVSTMRLVEVTTEAELVEVGTGRQLSGQFERATSNTGESTLSFVSEKGDTFLVANDPAGATVGRNVEVWAYPVQLSMPQSSEQSLWIICPCSAADLWEWRARRRSPRWPNPGRTGV